MARMQKTTSQNERDGVASTGRTLHAGVVQVKQTGRVAGSTGKGSTVYHELIMPALQKIKPR